MTEQTKNQLAIANGLGEERRKELTAQEIGKYYSLSKEIGILGDAVEYLFELVSQLHEGVNVDPAFTAWRSTIAEIKQGITEEITKLQA